MAEAVLPIAVLLPTALLPCSAAGGVGFGALLFADGVAVAVVATRLREKLARCRGDLIGKRVLAGIDQADGILGVGGVLIGGRGSGSPAKRVESGENFYFSVES